MKKLLFFAALLLSTFTAHSQGWVWAKDAVGTGGSGGTNVIADGSGNVYVTGKYTGSIMLGSTVLTYDSSSTTPFGLFIVKYDSLGDVIWAKSIGVCDGAPPGFTIDKFSNIYLTDAYQDSINFGDVSLFSSCGVFLAKFDSSGHALWAKSSNCPVGFGPNAYSVALGTDSFCNIYMVGNYSGFALRFGSITLDTGSSSGSIFLFKFDSLGNPVWAHCESGGAGLGTQANALSVDKFNNIYISGQYSDTITFGSFHVSFGGQAMFLTKYDASGHVSWAKSVGTWWSNGIVLASDVFGNVFVSGQYDSSITFGTTTLTVSGQAIFLAKYDSSGNAIWAKGTSSVAGGSWLN